MPAGTDHYVGGTKHFECRVKGHPRPNIRWFKDGTEITDNPRYKFDHTHEGVISMVIENIIHDDEGHYRCRAENSEGLASTSAYLFVRAHKEHPEESHTSIHAMEIEEVVLAGKSLRGASTKSAEPHFQTPIEDVDESHSKVRRLSAEEEEVVRKSFEQVIESAESTRVISSSAKTKVEQDSQKISADLREKSYHSSDDSGDDVDSVKLKTISERSETSIHDSLCDFASDGERSLLMEQTSRIFSEELGLNGEVKTSASYESMSSKSESSMVVKKETKDGKTISSTVESSSSSFSSSSKTEVRSTKSVGQKTVAVSKEEVEEESYTESETGSEVGSVVGVDQVRKKVTKQDSKEKDETDGTTRGRDISGLLDDDKTQEVVEQRSSWVEQVSTETQAEKTETVTEESQAARAKEEKPRLVQTPQKMEVQAGKTLKLRSTIEGSPNPQVSWSRDGRSLQAGERITMVTENDVYTLEIRETGPEDAGTYRLTARNSVGEIFTDIPVTVTGSSPSEDGRLDLTASVNIPRFVMQPQDVSVSEFETIKLVCTVRGEPNPSISWEKDGKKLRANRRMRLYESRGSHYLEIPEAEADDAGEYVCTAVNSHGTVSATVHVTIEGMESIISTSELADEQGAMAAAAPLDVTDSSDVCTNPDTRTVRYLKLFGAAAAFSLAAFGVKKVMENLPK